MLHKLTLSYPSLNKHLIDNVTLVTKILFKLQRLHTKRSLVTLTWILSHIGTTGHEKADRAASGSYFSAHILPSIIHLRKTMKIRTNIVAREPTLDLGFQKLTISEMVLGSEPPPSLDIFLDSKQ